MLDDETRLDAVTLGSLLDEYRRGGSLVFVDYPTAHRCLRALGRPLTLAQVKDLVIDTRVLGGKAVAPLGEFVDAADPFIKRAIARPNLKARAAKQPRGR